MYGCSGCAKGDTKINVSKKGNTELPPLLHQIYRMKEVAPLLGFIDQARMSYLIPFALAEIAELAEALEDLELARDLNLPANEMVIFLNKMLDEAMDIMVFFLSYVIAAGKTDELLHIPGHINGAAKRSDFLDVLTQTIGDADPSKADTREQLQTRQEVYRLFVSMIRHFPGLGARAELVMDRTIRKVLSNRAPEFYTVTERGKTLSHEELTHKYQTLETILRAMRKKVGRTLTAQDRALVAPIAQRWREPVDGLLKEVALLPVRPEPRQTPTGIWVYP